MQADLTPTIDEFRPVVPRVLADGQNLRVRDVCELVTDHMGLTAEVRAEMIASGQLRYVNRINWADSALTHAGVLDRPARGNYRITDDGRTVGCAVADQLLRTGHAGVTDLARLPSRTCRPQVRQCSGAGGDRVRPGRPH